MNARTRILSLGRRLVTHHFRPAGFAAGVIAMALVASLGLGLGESGHITSAQTLSTDPWSPPVNLSNSGSASQPVVALARSGVSHVMWWDSFDGMRYVQASTPMTGVTSLTQTLTLTQTRPTIVPGLWGERQIVTDTRTARQTVTLTPPRLVRLMTDPANRAHAFWSTVNNQLFYTTLAGAPGSWSKPAALADSVSTIAAASDVSGTLHLVFVRSVAAKDLPPGLYYRGRNGATWSPATLVYSNTYFRADRAENITLGVAADGAGAVVVTWYQARLGQSFFARSADAGRTWSPPEAVSGSAGQIAARSAVAVGPGGEFTLVYQDPLARGCGFSQRKSVDGGTTWGAPEISLSELTQCPTQWHLASATNKLWFIGTMAQSPAEVGAAPDSVRPVTAIIASSDGTEWSAPAELALSAYDSAIRQERVLGCLQIAMAGEGMTGVGCDVRSDVWLASASVSLDKLIVAPDLTWGKFREMSDRSGSVSSPASMALMKQSDLFALWSQTRPGELMPTELYISQWDGANWLRPTRIMVDPKSKFDQPFLAASGQDKLHLVWNGGTVRYSQAFARDAAVEGGWSKAADLPLPANTNVARSPHILADTRANRLYVVFSVPYNEKRGIYLVRSDDNGNTWSEPVSIFDAVAAGWESADAPQLQLDVDDSLHVVWLKANLGNRADPQAVFYARSTDHGQTWSQAQLVVEGDVYAPQVAIPKRGQVYVLWNQKNAERHDATPFETWGRLSLDGGDRWSDATVIPGFRQVSGQVALATDGAGRLYLAGMTESAGGESELVYASWAGQDWSPLETVGLGQRAAQDNQASSSIMAETSQFIALARTSVFTDSDIPQFQILSSSRAINAAPVVAQPTLTPLPSPTVQPVSQTSESTLSLVEPSPTVPVNILTAPQAQPQEQGSQLRSIGSIAGVIVLGLVVIAYGFWRRSRR